MGEGLRFALPHRLLYTTLASRCHGTGLLVAPATPATGAQRTPLVAAEGGADGKVLEKLVPPQEVHAEGQVVGAQALHFSCTLSRATLQLADPAFLRGACTQGQGRVTTCPYLFSKDFDTL